MLNMADKTKCTGCTACASVCPQSAIAMIPDEEGFLYPHISPDMCTDCGLCEQICPAQKSAEYEPQRKRRGFLVKHTNEAVLADSTSGGFFTPVAEWTFQQGGVVCAATFDDHFQVIHAFAEIGTDLHRFRGSKYVQSNLNECFVRIRDMLKEGRIVTFVGTPCQVYGLKAFLGKEDPRLYTVDLVCHGVPSPKLWDAYLQYQQKKYRSEIVDVHFRSKIYGYQSGTMKIRFANGREYTQGGKNDLMLRSFYGDVASRPSCYACPFKVLERCSDFTVYDAWNAHRFLPELCKADDKGYTNVIVHTERAVHLLNQLQCICFTEINVERAIALDGVMVRKSAVPHPKRSAFYRNMSADTIAEQVQACIPVSRTGRLLRNAKPVLYKIGLLGLTKKLKQIIKKF